MKLFLTGAIIYIIGLLVMTIVRFSPPSYVKEYDAAQKGGCYLVLAFLVVIGCILMIISHY